MSEEMDIADDIHFWNHMDSIQREFEASNPIDDLAGAPAGRTVVDNCLHDFSSVWPARTEVRHLACRPEKARACWRKSLGR